MTLRINILGLGLSRSVWRKLNQVILKRLSRDGFELEFHLLTSTKLDELAIALDSENINPDIIFLSLSGLKDNASVDQLFQKLPERFQSNNVFILEKDVKKTVLSHIITSPSVNFQFFEYGDLVIRDPEILLTKENEVPVKIPITPIPKVEEYEDKNPYLDHSREVSFFYLDRINRLTWKGIDTSAEKLVSDICRQLNESKPADLKGILVYNQNALLINGLHIVQIQGVQIGEFYIDQMLSFRDIAEKSVNFELMIRRINEKMKEKSCSRLREANLLGHSYVKRNTPLVIQSEFPVVGLIFKQLLLADKYAFVRLAEESNDIGEQFILRIGESDNFLDTPDYSLNINPAVFDIPGFPQVRPDLAARPIEGQKITAIQHLRKERSQVIRKIESLEGQLKNLSSSKVLADQEKYMNLLASRKLEIISVLLELASIWDETNQEEVNTYEEDVLVLHEDKTEANYLNSRLVGEGKRLFLDISENLSDLRTFVSLNTDLYEPFLHEGIIICSPSGKRLLISRLEEIQTSLEDKKYPDVISGLNKLKAKKRSCQNRLIELAYEEAVGELRDTLKSENQSILETAANRLKKIDQERFAIDKLREICFLASTEQLATVIKNSFMELYSLGGGIRLHTIAERLSIDTETRHNEDGTEDVTAVSHFADFMLKSSRQLKELSVDLLVIEHNFYVVNSFVKTFRQASSPFRFTPIIAFFSGEFDQKSLETMINMGVRPFYVDKWKARSVEAYQSKFALCLT